MLYRAFPHEAAVMVDCRQVFIAHELYHHLDGAEQRPLLKRFSVDVLRIGRLVLRRPLPLLEELAAGAFAQSLLGLSFHPRLLDVMFVCDANPSKAVQVLCNMRQRCRDPV